MEAKVQNVPVMREQLGKVIARENRLKNLKQRIDNLPLLLRRRMDMYYTMLPHEQNVLQKISLETKIFEEIVKVLERQKFTLAMEACQYCQRQEKQIAIKLGFKEEDKEAFEYAKSFFSVCLLNYFTDTVMMRHTEDTASNLKNSAVVMIDSYIIFSKIGGAAVERYYQNLETVKK